MQRSPQAILEKAMELQGSGDHQGALTLYDELLGLEPGHPQILNLSANVLAQLGQHDSAVTRLNQAVENLPDFADAWMNLGLIQQHRGNFKGARDAYAQYRLLQPASEQGHLNFANACQQLGDLDLAIPAYEKAISLSPANPSLWANLARAHLHMGAWERCLEAADRTLALSTGNTSALAIKSAALAELELVEDLGNLVDFDRFIAIEDFEPPSKYKDIAEFNELLCAHCKSHASLEYEPSENTTKKGHQTGNLSLDKNQGPIAELLALIDQAVKRYQENRPVDSGHPFLANPPKSWGYDIWATILGSQGHQAPHIHRSGWLSGCYYARIPEVISEESRDMEGWIEFGRPQDYPKATAEPRVRSYRPHEGMVVLFPSYFYHRTVPFESPDERISIAFDILPLS